MPTTMGTPRSVDHAACAPASINNEESALVGCRRPRAFSPRQTHIEPCEILAGLGHAEDCAPLDDAPEGQRSTQRHIAEKTRCDHLAAVKRRTGRRRVLEPCNPRRIARLDRANVAPATCVDRAPLLGRQSLDRLVPKSDREHSA